MLYTPATENDIPFITDAIFAAVKSGKHTLSYETLFERTEDELRPAFAAMLAEDIENQELWLSGFLIAKDEDNNPAATCCAWTEDGDNPSSMLTAQLLSYYLGKETFQKGLDKSTIIESLRVDREPGVLQIEHVYTSLSQRGKGLAEKVIRQQIENHKAQNPDLKKVQIILFKTNENALKAYSKLGFTAAFEKHSDYPGIQNYFPADTRILMEMQID